MNKKIIYFDGQCLTCHQAVKFIHKHDLNNEFMFSPIGSQSFIKNINNEYKDIDSLFLYTEDEIFYYFGAVTAIANEIFEKKHPIRILLKLIPSSIGNFLYTIIAKLRQVQIKIAPSDICKLQTSEEDRAIQNKIIY